MPQQRSPGYIYQLCFLRLREGVFNEKGYVFTFTDCNNR